MTRLPRRIDHVVVAVRDLDVAGAFYRRLGFQVGARNRHPWGTENRLIQFGSSFIELIAVAPDADAIPEQTDRRFSFGAFVRDYLRSREGLAMLALDSDDANADAALFARTGLGSFEPFFFERKTRRPDGSETHVAFTLAFAVDPQAPNAGFFVCQQHHPENFWNPTFQRHENGALDLAVVGMTSARPESHTAFLTAFTGAAAHDDNTSSLTLDLRGGKLEVISGASDWPDPDFRFMTIRIPDLAAQAQRLSEAGIAFALDHDRLSIPAEAAVGLELRFEAPSEKAEPT